jgi:hypothetical protein
MAGQRIFRDLIASGKYKGRTKCIVTGCDKPGQNMGIKRKDGTTRYRATCEKHHATKYGIGDWVYKKYRKDYCENVDGRLGFMCTTTILLEHAENMLDTDHINNNHDDNSKSNMQTLCACCHRIKTKTMGHLTNLSYIKRLMWRNAHNFS